MSAIEILMLATFAAPERISPNPQSMLWLLPLAAAIAIVYKATKLRTIKAGVFLKEAAILFGSIVGFIIITALALYALVWAISV
jgi:hypothetical protein